MDSETELLDLIAELTPALTEGRHDRVRRIAARLEELVRAALPAGSRDLADRLDTIGRAYKAVGDTEDALRVFRNEIDIRDTLDPDDTDVLDLVSQVGLLYLGTNRLKEAVPYVRRGLALLREDRECEPAVLRDTIRDLARIEAEVENLAEAEVLYRELIERTRAEAGDRALELAADQTELAGMLTLRGGATLEARALLVSALDIQRGAHDADPVAMARTLSRLGLNHQRRGDPREALPLFEEAVRLRQHALPGTAPEIADALNNVGMAYLELGDLFSARKALQHAEALLLASEVPDRYRLVFVDTNLADLDRQTGRYADGEFHARRATENAIELFSEEHPQTAAALNSLALIHQATGRLEEALTLIEAVVRIRRAQTPPAPLEEMLALNNLGTVRASLGMYDDALAILRETYERAVGIVGENHALTAGTLDNQAQVHRLMGRSKTGIELARRAVEIHRSVQGERHRDFAGSLSGLARLLIDEKQYFEAETVQLQAIAIEREILGPDHIRYGIDLGTLGTIYRQTGRLKEAEETDRLALEITVRAVGPDHSEVATQLVNLASDVDQLGDLDTAIDLARDAREISRRALGDVHPESITGLYNLAALLVKRGNFLEARPLAAQALEIARQFLRPDQREYSFALGKLSDIQEELGNYALAEALLLEKLEVDTRAFGESDPRNALLLSALAGVCRENGKLPEAAGYAARSVAMLREHGGESDPRYPTVLSNEALVDLVRGDYALARQKLLQVQEIETRGLGQSAATFSNLGTVYKEAGLYAEAEECYRRAIEIAGRAVGPNHRGTATLLNNLAMLRAERGDFTEAERLLLQSGDVKAKTIGQSGPSHALTLNNLAGIYARTGAYASARRVLEQALEIEIATLGPVHPLIATTLSMLAHHYLRQDDTDMAELLVRQSLEMDRQIYDDAHRRVAGGLDTLGWIHLSRDELDEAERCYSEALALLRQSFPPGHPEIASSLNNLSRVHDRRGDFVLAEKLQREALESWIAAHGEEHPELSTPFSNMAGITAAQGRYDEALEWMQRREALNDRIVVRTLPGLSEYRCLGWLDSMRLSMECVLSLVVRKLLHAPAAVRMACDLVLRRKAIAFEVLASQRATVRHEDSELSEAMQELAEQRRRLSEESFADPAVIGPEEHRRRSVALENRVEELEAHIARTSPAVGLEQRLRHATRASIAAALPPDAALVELVRFDVINFDAVAPQKPWDAPRYAAFVIQGGKPNDVVLLDLGDAEGIDRKIDAFRGWIRWSSPSTDPERNGSVLREAVFDPIVRAAPGRQRLFIAPDGSFNRLPFEALPAPSDGFVLDTHHISYVIAGRDLAASPDGARPNRSRAPLVAADPDFDLSGEDAAPRYRDPRDFKPLPDARTEGVEVADALGVKPLLGDQVLKATIENVRGPRILHLATHGFFLPDPRTAKRAPMVMTTDRAGISLFHVVPENPLLRSGLALAGANRAHRGLPLPPAAGNGVLLAVDVLGLDLLGTELVVLSACETGLGDIRATEGVYGLRRTFLLAGARTLITSLWSVPDRATRTLMIELYAQILARQPRSDALRSAQRSIRGNLETRHPFYWGAFICVGQAGPIGVAG